MKEFLQILQAEQAPINNAIERAVQSLPLSVQEIASYALTGGKRLRPMLTLMSARLINPQITIEDPRIYDAAIVLEMFHVASLLHDDVLDNADTRRGKTSVHIKYGIRPCLLAGDALLAAGNRLMAEFENPLLMTSISNALLRTSTGEIEEISLVGKILPQMQDYLSVIEGKTAWILRSACEVGAIFASMQNNIHDDKNAPNALAEFGLNLGMAFQIVDDALDFAPEEITGKPQGGDLRERKCTPPILMYAQSLGELTNSEKRQEFEKKFACVPTPPNTVPLFTSSEAYTEYVQRELKEKEIQEIIQTIVEQKYPEKTKELAVAYLEKAEQALSDFSGEYKTVLLQTLQYVKDRKK